MSVRRYDLHGVLLDVDCEDAAVAQAIDGRLRPFHAERDGDPDVSYELRVVRHGEHDEVRRPLGAGRPVYEPPAGEVLYFEDEDALWIGYEDRIRILVTSARARVRVSAAAAGDLWLLSRPLFTIPLIELLKRHGLFNVHAAAVAHDGRALLVPGASGSGKSTLSVALARAGWAFMADDTVFVTGAATAAVHAFPDEIDISHESARFFPELAQLARPAPDGWPKHRLRVDEQLGAAIEMRAAAAALVFPSERTGGASRLEPMEPAAALLALTPNVLLTDPRSSQAQLDVLGAIVRGTPAYRLIAGSDFGALAERLRDLVAAP